MEKHNYIEISKNIWVVNSHEWAWFVWEKNKLPYQTTLIHIDYHWDAICDFKSEDEIRCLKKLECLSQIEELLINTRLITEASFIAPAIIRQLFNEVHFLCVQQKDLAGPFDDSFLINHGCEQFVHPNLESLVNASIKIPFVLDLDLDYFCRDERFRNQTQISDFLTSASSLFQRARLITLSKSNKYSWNLSDDEDEVWSTEIAKSVYEIVLPKIIKFSVTSK